MKCECTTEDSNLEWDSGGKKLWWFSPFFSWCLRKVKTVYPVTLNPILTVSHLLLFSCDVMVDILLLGC